jgi:hypothetical protein
VSAEAGAAAKLAKMLRTGRPTINAQAIESSDARINTASP